MEQVNLYYPGLYAIMIQTYKLGFTDVYLGIKVPGPHTQQYLMGYANGTESLESNRGSVAADNAISLSPGHTQDYIGGYQQSMYFRSPNQSSDHSLPAHTNDNYTHFYIGYHDGAVAEDNYNSHNGPYKSTCADGHTHEYCAGYKAGFIAEEDANS